ncbi:hypothetical protein HMPREF0491_02945 [Lachnospiraceae oral taxon 107 str. F0167]|nr:hypothetical protein HMPREF0491_02945 [Lachnospiraceae oral taxon 107 str. F0167]
MDISESLRIVSQALSILKNEYAFHKSTICLGNAFFTGVSEKEYISMDNKLKAIRQDFAKILIIMNSIDRTYLAYKSDKYISSFFSIIDSQATSELGCFIEYLFAKYRVILEYIQQILNICIPPSFNEIQKEEYSKLQKSHKKYKYLLKYISENIDKTNSLLNTDWFQNIRIDRDFIIHDGATCFVFSDKENLLFKVMTTDALDKEEKSEPFFENSEGLKYYVRYWGMHISKLIVFAETVFEFLIKIGHINNENMFLIHSFYSKEKVKIEDSDGTELNDVQDVLIKMLETLMGEIQLKA